MKSSNSISERISDNITPQMKILNMVIPIRMCFYSLVSNWSVGSHIKPHKGVCHPTKCDVINDIKLFSTVCPSTVYRRIYSISQDILSQIFDVIQSDLARNKSQCIRI